ncbi:MAG: hypothetical protein EOP85_00420 [Verrucomicrobiaceae bacterium]|nr:MAG: hypothetical protein EOP85_00420 [Verrucomicrobiaceae bacterium]
MKSLTNSLVLLALTPLSLSAAVTTFSGLSYEQPLTALPGWTASEANPTNAPLAWAEPVAGNMAGAIGGAYAEAVNTRFSTTMASSFYSSMGTISLDVMLRSSTSIAPGRDSFTVGVATVGGTSLIDIVFAPAVTVAGIDRWEVGYAVSGGTINYTGLVLNEDAWYDIGLAFDGPNFAFTFGNSVSTNTATGTITGFDGATAGVGDLTFGWNKASATPYGDNYMLFDNVESIPEPSAALLGGLASIFLFRRRR